MFFYTVLFLVLVSFAYGALLYYCFKYTQTVDKKSIMKGEQINFKFSIHNEWLLLYPCIKIGFYGEDYTFNRQAKKITFTLGPFSHKEVNCQWECKYRGDYPIGIEYIEIKDILGIFSFYYYIREPREIKVYPRINFLTQFPMNTSYIHESDTIIKSDVEDMSSISDIRGYAYGDTLRKVHWKLTAKKNEWMVKNYDNTAQLFVVMFIDLKKNSYYAEQNLILEDQVVECIVTIVYYCLRNWIPVELVYYNEGIRMLKGRNSLDFKTFYDFMRGVKFNQDISLTDMMSMYLRKDIPKTNIILFTSNLEYKLYEQIYEARFVGYDIILIYISPKEIRKKGNEEEKSILKGLREIGVVVYEVQISDDIKQILGC